MRTSEFDSSSEEEEVGEEQLTPLHISWLPLSVVECSQFLGICGLPGCKYKDVRRSLERDVEELQNQGVQEVFVFCTRAELHWYRVPSLLDVYQQQGFTVHHMPFPDGDAPELEQCCRILEELQASLESNRRTLIHCYGGLGRSGLSKNLDFPPLDSRLFPPTRIRVAACLLLRLSETLTENKVIEILRELRGGGAIQTVKQYNFLHEFREKYSAYLERRQASPERSVSR